MNSTAEYPVDPSEWWEKHTVLDEDPVTGVSVGTDKVERGGNVALAETMLLLV